MESHEGRPIALPHALRGADYGEWVGAQLGPAGLNLVEEAIDVWANMDFFADDRWHEAERNVKEMQVSCSAKIESIEKKLALLNTGQDRSNNGDTGAMQSQLAETQRQLAATKADLKQEQQKYMKSLEQGETELVKADNMVQAEKRRAEELAKQLEEFKRANQQANASSASTSVAELQAVQDKLYKTEGELKYAQDKLHKMEGEQKQAKQSVADLKDSQDKLHKMEGELKQAKQSEEHARKEAEQLRAEVTGAREGKDEISGRMKELESANKQLKEKVRPCPAPQAPQASPSQPEPCRAAPRRVRLPRRARMRHAARRAA